MFFTSRPNLSPNEKAQVELCFQWLADCIGRQRMDLPVLGSEKLLTDQTISECVRAVGSHLQHNVDQLQIVMEPQLLEKCGSGG